LSGRGLCDELITRPEESYRLWCVVVCILETSRMRRPWLALGRSATENKYISLVISSNRKGKLKKNDVKWKRKKNYRKRYRICKPIISTSLGFSTDIVLIQQNTRGNSGLVLGNGTTVLWGISQWIIILHLQQINIVASRACSIANKVHLNRLPHLNSPCHICATHSHSIQLELNFTVCGVLQMEWFDISRRMFPYSFQITTLYVKKGKVPPCTDTEALYRPYGP